MSDLTDAPTAANHPVFGSPPDPDDPATFPPGTFIEHDGQRFRVAGQVGLMALMDYAEIAEEGVDSDAIAGLAAMKRLLRDLIDERDWQRFRRWTLAARVDGDTFGEIIGKAMALIGDRPTESSSGSPGGRPSTGPRSNGTSGAAGSPVDAWTERKRALGIVPIDEDVP